MESLGNDDVSPLNSPKYEMVRDDVKQKMPEETAWVDFVTFTALLPFYRFAFRLFRDILWSSCFEAGKRMSDRLYDYPVTYERFDQQTDELF